MFYNKKNKTNIRNKNVTKLHNSDIRKIAQRDPIGQKLLKKILLWLEKQNYYKLNRLLISILLLGSTGMRIMELACITGYKLEDLIFRGWCTIYQSKTRVSRNIVLIKWAQNKLKEYYISDSLPGKFLLLGTSKSPTLALNRSHFTRLINKILREFCIANELPINLKSHSFRIGLITDLFEAEHSIDQIQGIIGHRDTNTTFKYSRYQIPMERQLSILETREKKD